MPGWAGSTILTTMPLFMYQASYTAKSMAEQLKEPQDPVETIRPALEDLGRHDRGGGLSVWRL